MDFAKISLIFKFLIIAIVYIIIFFALKIIYKDIKNGGRKKGSRSTFGIEIVDIGKNSNLKKGSIIPIRRMFTIGRKEDNNLMLMDPYVSGHHAKIYIKNNYYYIEDVGSTNGTIVNGKKIDKEKIELKSGDKIEIGSLMVKVI